MSRQIPLKVRTDTTVLVDLVSDAAITSGVNIEFATVNSLTQTLPRSWSSSYSRSSNSRSFNSIYNKKQQVTRVQRGDQGPDDTGGDLSDNLDSGFCFTSFSNSFQSNFL